MTPLAEKYLRQAPQPSVDKAPALGSGDEAEEPLETRTTRGRVVVRLRRNRKGPGYKLVGVQGWEGTTLRPRKRVRGFSEDEDAFDDEAAAEDVVDW